MKSLSANLTAQKDAAQSGWVELIDIYLPESVTTPFGSTDTIRLASAGVDFAFFAPLDSPEPAATQGNAQTYQAWPFKRRAASSNAKFQNDKLTIALSNVTAEFSQSLNAVDWRGSGVVIRKTSSTLAAPVAADHTVIFSGRIDAARLTLQTIELTCSSGFAVFSDKLPAEDMHSRCRFRWADEFCSVPEYGQDNFKPKTAKTASTVTRIKTDLTGWAAASVTADPATDQITLATHLLSTNHRVRFHGTTVPGGLTRGRWYYITVLTANTFTLHETPGGATIDITSAGSAVTMDSETGFTEDQGNPPYSSQAVTADAATDKISLASHTLLDGDRVQFTADTMPGGLTAGTWYYVVNKAANDFQVEATEGGGAIDITTAGSAVLMTSAYSYGTDLIDALANSAITSSSYQVGNEEYRVRYPTYDQDTPWKFSDSATNPAGIDSAFTPYVALDFGSAVTIVSWQLDHSALAWPGLEFTFYHSSDGSTYTLFDRVEWTRNNVTQTDFRPGVPPSARYYRVQIRRNDNTAFTDADSPLAKLRAYTSFGGADQVDLLANGSITASSEGSGNEAYYVKDSNSGSWLLNNAPAEDEIGLLDWGVNLHGYWQIPDDQAGLANPLLKPYIQFDLGSAKTPRLWRFWVPAGVERDQIPRVLQIHSHTGADFSTGSPTHEINYEIPAVPGRWHDCLIPAASTARYWRICVRSHWAESLSHTLLAAVQAFEKSRHYWQDGWVEFAADTPTAALQNVKRPILGSYSGAIDVQTLPAAPAIGDRLTIRRGCPRTFNACAARQNLAHFGGFTTLPEETVLR